MTDLLPPGYCLQPGSATERSWGAWRNQSLLVKFMQQTYEELYPGGAFSHLANTVEQYYSSETPIWWVMAEGQSGGATLLSGQTYPKPIGCLWLGNAIDQATGEHQAHIFLLYVEPNQRHQGIGSALMHQAETWAKSSGARQIGLQVFETNQPALSLYRSRGYQTKSLWLAKPL